MRSFTQTPLKMKNLKRENLFVTFYKWDKKFYCLDREGVIVEFEKSSRRFKFQGIFDAARNELRNWVPLQKLLRNRITLPLSNVLSSDSKERFNKFFFRYTIPLTDIFYLSFSNHVHSFNASDCSPCCMKRLIS